MRKYTILIICAVLALLGLAIYLLRDALLGISFLCILASLCCFFLCFMLLTFWPWSKPRLQKLSRLLRRLGYLLAILLVVSFALVQWAIWHTAAEAEGRQPDGDYLLVLGAGLYGERPSPALVERLNAALPYLRDNPQSLAVLSGGKGRGETVSEALAMQRWLVAHGIEAERLLLEDRSTSTAENIAFSKPILAALGAEKVIIVSNDFHLFRAQKLAVHYGLEAELIGRPVPKMHLIPLSNYLREYFAVCKELLQLYIFPFLLPAVPA